MAVKYEKNLYSLTPSRTLLDVKTDESPSPWRRRPGPLNQSGRRSKKVPQDGDRIYQRRIEAGLRQGELAALANISPQHMSHIEQNKFGASPEALGRLADVLKCTVADLMPTSAGEAESA